MVTEILRLFLPLLFPGSSSSSSGLILLIVIQSFIHAFCLSQSSSSLLVLLINTSRCGDDCLLFVSIHLFHKQLADDGSFFSIDPAMQTDTNENERKKDFDRLFLS